MDIVLLIDFGSTHTKILAVDIILEEIVGRAQAVTTVETDITIGLNKALEILFSRHPIRESDVIGKYASSSAAGGLRMAAIGLVPALTLEAARRAALGAGAKVVWSSANNVFVFAMNPAKYNSLSPELKKVIDQNSGIKASKWAGEVFHSCTSPARNIALKRHNTINVLSDVEYKRWVKAAESVDEGWIKEVVAKGGNGQALLNDAKALLKKYND